MSQFIYIFLHLLERIFRKFHRIFLSWANKWRPAKIQQKHIIRSTCYDMVLSPDEPYYAQQYWTVMLPHFNLLQGNASILDLGCGQGRFSIELAKHFSQGTVIGCDLSTEAINNANEYAVSNSVENVIFKAQSIADCLTTLSKNSIDLIILTEVTIFYPEWKLDLPKIIELTKPGGLLVISFRSQFYNMLSMVRNKSWEETKLVLQKRQGTLYGSSVVFSWQSSEEIKAMIVNEYGLELLDLFGIGVCSGIPGDPHDFISRPSLLNESEKVDLMKLELEMGRTLPDAGRYILAIARVN